jgi:hypothetical protein
MADALTPTEQALVKHVEQGELLDLTGDSQTVRASVIRDIMRGRLAPDPDPHGLRLRGARIDGRLDLANITSPLPFELSDCQLDEGLDARNAQLTTVALAGCRLGSTLHAAHMTATVLDISGATIEAHAERGAVNVNTAHLGRLNADNAKLHNDSGPALYGKRLRVDHNVHLTGGFVATGSGERGAINLVDAHFGRLNADNAKLRNDSGPALDAERLRVDRNVFMRDGFEATGSDGRATLQLQDAHVGQLECDGATLRNDSGPALNGRRLRVDQDVYLRNGFDATGTGETVVVNLVDSRIGGVLVFAPARLEHSTDPRKRLNVNGLVYNGLPEGISTPDWLLLLREGTPGYAAQPYQQLAAAHRAVGHDSQARHVLMEQRRDQIRRRAITGRAERAWARLTGLTLGYGYQPWRALFGLLAVIATTTVLAAVLGGHGGLATTNSPPASCTVVERIGVGLDLGTPLVTTNGRSRCDTTDAVAGQVLTITGWVLRLLAWGFATLFIAGFTSAVRKT